MGKTNIKTRCLILGGGDICDYAAVSARLDESFFVICADSGFVHCKGLKLKPDLLVGDFDSIGALPEGIETVTFPAEKDYTDTMLAVKTAVDKGFKELLFAGMLGGRFDHSLANLQTLAHCARLGLKASFFDGGTEVFAVRDGNLVLTPRENSYFSVLSLTSSCQSVTITGGKYPLDAYTLSHSDPRAVSNEFTDENAVIAVTGGTAAVVITGKQDAK